MAPTIGKPAIGKNAVVIGAGMAGLAAAEAIADHVERVTILERDALPDRPEPRAGTPQSSHPHGLLDGGMRALCTQFPGFDRDLARAGAVPLRISLDVREEFPNHDPFPRREMGWTGYTMSRPLIEHVTRQRVQQHENILVKERCRALEILPAADRSVAAVKYQTADGNQEILPSDLVVDASSRGATTLGFLAATGRGEPTRTEIGIDMNYATTTFAIPDGLRDWKLVITFPDMQASSRTGYLMPIEGNRWMVLISERHVPARPLDGDEFLELARGLRTPTIHDAIRHATRLDRIHRFGFRENSWQHYDRLDDFPRGLLPIGDAVCRFNPVYGQGMTVAAQEACVLRGLLQNRAGSNDPLAGLEAEYLAAIQPLIAAAWSQSAIPDFAHPETRGAPPERLADTLRFGQALIGLAARDPDVHRRLVRVRHLAEPPSILRDPDLVRRVQAEMADAS